MQAYIPAPPFQLTQPMTGITHWQSPTAVVPLTGYPSAYPHVVNVSDYDFAAPYLGPAAYQQMMYQPPVQPTQVAVPKPARTAARAARTSVTPQAKAQPATRDVNLRRYDDSILQAMGVKPKRPDWSRILPFTDETRQRLGADAATVDTQPQDSPQPTSRTTFDMEPFFDSISEYVPREFLLGTAQPQRSLPVAPPVAARPNPFPAFATPAFAQATPVAPPVAPIVERTPVAQPSGSLADFAALMIPQQRRSVVPKSDAGIAAPMVRDPMFDMREIPEAIPPLERIPVDVLPDELAPEYQRPEDAPMSLQTIPIIPVVGR